MFKSYLLILFTHAKESPYNILHSSICTLHNYIHCHNSNVFIVVADQLEVERRKKGKSSCFGKSAGSTGEALSSTSFYCSGPDQT